MSDEIPEYYRHFQSDRSSAADGEAEARRSARGAADEGSADEADSEARAPTYRRYRADAFRLRVPAEGWTDATTYTLTGPVADGIRHNITILTDDDLDPDAVSDLETYAAHQRDGLEERLDECRVLHEDAIVLHCGLDAHRVIFRWRPDEDTLLYQEQLYVWHEGIGYTLTASFTQATRKRYGAEVEALMRSFRPRSLPADSASDSAHDERR